MALITELKDILSRVGPDNIWRPVYGNPNLLLAPGIADPLEDTPEDLAKIDFRNKTVIDLGVISGIIHFWPKNP